MIRKIRKYIAFALSFVVQKIYPPNFILEDIKEVEKERKDLLTELQKEEKENIIFKVDE